MMRKANILRLLLMLITLTAVLAFSYRRTSGQPGKEGLESCKSSTARPLWENLSHQFFSSL